MSYHITYSCPPLACLIRTGRAQLLYTDATTLTSRATSVYAEIQLQLFLRLSTLTNRSLSGLEWIRLGEWKLSFDLKSRMIFCLTTLNQQTILRNDQLQMITRTSRLSYATYLGGLGFEFRCQDFIYLYSIRG